MRSILDTNAFFYTRALRRLPADARVVVPGIVFVERARQLKRDGRGTPSALLRSILGRGWVIEPFREDQALRAAHLAPTSDELWRQLARDVLVAAHVRDEDVILTANTGDFIELGLRPEQLRDPSRLP